MTIVERMRAQLTESMKARDTVRTGFLRYWIAQLTTGSGAEVPEAEAIKKMRADLEGGEGRADHVLAGRDRALIKRMGPAQPSAPSRSPRRLVAVREQIKAAPKDGMAMGIAMKALSGQPVESDDVKAAVASLRQ